MADHRGFEHCLVADERGLDLYGRNVEARDSQHVVGTAGVYEVTVSVLPELVATPEPRADEGRAAFLAVVPVTGCTRRSAYLELADLAPLYRSPLLVHQAQLVTGHGLAGRSVAHIPRPGADEHVQHLGRTDALQDVDAGPFFPAPAHVGRQGFAGRDAKAQREELLLRKLGAGEHRPVERRDGVEDRGPRFGEALEYRRRRRTLGHEHGGRAGRESESLRVAEAIRKGQLRRGKEHVVLGDAQNALPIEIRGDGHARMHVHRGLRRAGRAGGVQPEAGIVAGRRGGREFAGAFREDPLHRFVTGCARATTTLPATSGCWSNAASISVGSMRYPRSFTW